VTPAPSPGVGAIVFTDIAGFTEFTAARGDTEALALLDLQEQLVRAAMPAEGRIVKELGDGLLLWLPDATAAVTTCLDLLDRFAEVDRDGAPLWVRMGMHWGAPTRRGDDLVGHAVNLAARIVEMAAPGELLVSNDVCDAVGWLASLRLEELGPVVMRGIPDPVGLFRATRRSADDEAAFGAGGRLVADVDAGDLGPGRAFAAPRDHRVDATLGALEHRLHPSVGEVAHPATDAVLLGLATTGVAEPHVLHPSGDVDVPADHTWQASQ
jgi:class 3 adenylate cyclase